jgi:hypothetical protein
MSRDNVIWCIVFLLIVMLLSIRITVTVPLVECDRIGKPVDKFGNSL